MTRKANLGICEIQPRRAFEKLNEHVRAVDLEDAAAALFAVRQLDLSEFVILYAVHLAQQHQRPRDLFYSSVFLDHISYPP